MNITKNLAVLNSSLKDMKKVLSKKCTFLSAYKSVTGEFRIKATISGQSWLYTTPYNLVFSKADWQELLSDINLKCQEDVRG